MVDSGGRWRVDLHQGAVDLGGWRRNAVRAIWPAGEAPRLGSGMLEEARAALVRLCGEKKDIITVVHES